MKRIHFVNSLDMAVRHPKLQMVFEAIIERLDIKINLFREMEKAMANRNCILSSNTLSFPIRVISSALQNKSRYKLVGIR